MTALYLLIIFLPFMSFVISFFFGFYIGRRGVIFVSNLFMFISAILSLHAAWLCFLDEPGTIIYFSFGKWLSIFGIALSWEFVFDSLSVVMCVVITVISFLVHIFSVDYMRSDPYKVKFFSFISLFTFFMLVLVCSNNFLVLFLG